MVYLRDIVKQSGGTLHLKIESIGSAQQLRSKSGETYEVKPVTFIIPATGKQIVENIFATTFEFDLSGVTAGMHVEAFIKTTKTGKEVVGYKVLQSSAEQAFTTPSQTPQKQVQAERAASQALADFDLEKKAHDKKLGLAGIVQAQLVRGTPEYVIRGEEKPTVEAERNDFTAEQWVTWIAEKAKNMATAEVFAKDA